MTESELHEEIVELCKLYGLWWFHSYDSRRDVQGDTEYDRQASGKGFMDVVIVGFHGALFVEEKSEHERRSKAQIRWADRIVRAGLQYRLWRPADLKDGTIARELEAIR
jgi:hypothetical protein